MFKERDKISHPIFGYGEVVSVSTKRAQGGNYLDETTYIVYFNHGIRKIRDTSKSYTDLYLVERSL